MEPQSVGTSINCPSFFDGNNYLHKKVQMEFFLKIHGERVWNTVEYGWLPLISIDTNSTSIGELKPKKKLDDEGSEANAKSLYYIFNGVNSNESRKIATCN